MKNASFRNRCLVLCSAILFASNTHAQMVECDQAGLDGTAIPNGCIAKTLSEQVGPGQGDAYTYGSSVYLIKRDPARSIRRGRQLFQRKFSLTEGLGPRVNSTSSGSIIENRAIGAGFSDSCASCHGRPKGSAGFGGDVHTRPDSRDAPHLFGLGLVEQLADEMTTKLRVVRDRAIKKAIATGRRQKTELKAKRIDFGGIVAYPDGSVDTSGVVGVDADLRVRPFFSQGQTASIREFIVGAFKDEMGLQVWDPILCQATDPINPQITVSPAGFVYNPETDIYERPTVCDQYDDADEDGVVAEIDPALLDHLEFYLLNYFKPGLYRTSDETRKGKAIMKKIGCTECHRPNLRIGSDRRIADVETVYDPTNGIFNDLFATANARFDVVNDGQSYPLIQPQGTPFLVKNFFSDLKRHDLGAAFHEREFDGTMIMQFVTEPLWGVGSTAPYGHDGRSINLDAVIRRHGGEAEDSKQNYVNLNERKQRQVRSFLQTLVLFPPDDTASNLNPGYPGDQSNIQDPGTHGSINLGVLFQISEESLE